MSLNETRIDIPAEHVSNIFGQFDHNIKLIERTLNVTVVPRNEGIKVIGDTANVDGAVQGPVRAHRHGEQHDPP